MVRRRTSPIETPHVTSAAPDVERGDSLLAIGNSEFLSHQLDAAEVVIGRDSSCDFVIDHHSLSRRHAVLRIGPQATIQDLGSTNGTRCAGRTVRGGEPIALDDTGFRIGPYSFVVLRRGATPNAGTAAPEQLVVVDPTRAGAPPLVRSFAKQALNVLITGETGVGKEVLAATVHELSGRPGPFLQINCAALSETLLESELFGHERGAFTGAVERKQGLLEAADGGTIMLDEIGELAPATQAKLLRVLEKREVLRLGATRPVAIDVRFVAATNRDLVAEVSRGAFRTDLFYRLDGVTLTIPPLRERTGAIVPLALQFLERSGRTTQLAAAVIAALQAHSWPGNVRELKAVIERAHVLAGDGEIAVRHLTFTRTTSPSISLGADDSAERERIVQALAAAAGNQTRAAKELGISRTTLITKLRIYKVPRPSTR